MNEGYFHAADIEEDLGISRRKLRRYRETGLVSPSRTTAGGHGRYSPADVRRLRIAEAMRRSGLRGARVRALLDQVALEVEAIVAECLAGHGRVQKRRRSRRRKTEQETGVSGA